jgi:hypothetical protein
MATEEELKTKYEEWNALPLEMQVCFKEGFDMLIGRPYLLTLNENGGIALVRHLKKHGLEIRPIQEVEQMKEFIGFVRNAPVSSGVCCCGMSMTDHPEAMDCGHVATDQWHYDVSQWSIQFGVE